MSLTPLLEAHHKLAYSNNVKMVAQQMMNPLRAAVTEVPCDGEAKSAADLIGKVEARESPSRSRTNIENVPELSRRWFVRPLEIDSGQYYDKEDVFDRVYDDKSKFITTHTKAVQRGIGDKILGVRYVSKGNFELRDGGILGAAVDGKKPGSGKIVLPSACYTASGSAGLTLGKLKGAKERLNGDDFGLEDDDEMYCAISPKQVTDLLNLADGDGTSLNAFAQEQLRSGKPTPLLNLTWIVTNRLPVDANGDRMCPIWTKANIGLGLWQDVEGQIWNDTHAKNTPYAHVGAYVDAVRLEDLGVQVLLCAES